MMRKGSWDKELLGILRSELGYFIAFPEMIDGPELLCYIRIFVNFVLFFPKGLFNHHRRQSIKISAISVFVVLFNIEIHTTSSSSSSGRLLD